MAMALEDPIEIERRRDDARQPGEPLEPREPPVGRGLLLPQAAKLDRDNKSAPAKLALARDLLAQAAPPRPKSP